MFEFAKLKFNNSFVYRNLVYIIHSLLSSHHLFLCVLLFVKAGEIFVYYLKIINICS